jgi:hypothetical protein
VPKEEVTANLSRQESLSFGRAVSIVYETYMRQVWPDAKIWGDKNPSYIWHIPTIRSLFPNAKFINMIRDIRAVYLSTKKLAPKRVLIGRLSAAWKSAIETANRYGDCDFFMNVRYEDLVNTPTSTLSRISDFLGIEYDERMLNYYVENKKRRLVPSHRIISHHSSTVKPIFTNSVDNWKKELTRMEIEALEIVNERHLLENNYPMTTRGKRASGRLRIRLDHVLCSIRSAKAKFNRFNNLVCGWPR